MNLKFVLAIDGTKNEMTTLESGDIMVVHRVGTVGFHRGHRRLIGASGDDKLLAINEWENQTLPHLMAHFGIMTEVINETDRIRVYRLTPKK